jgi:hypothetical protein
MEYDENNEDEKDDGYKKDIKALRIKKNCKVKRVDLVVGGDHGQRKFRMVVKIICRDISNKILDSWVVKIAHVDCKHDTNEIRQKTIAPSLNADLKMLCNGRSVLELYLT